MFKYEIQSPYNNHKVLHCATSDLLDNIGICLHESQTLVLRAGCFYIRCIWYNQKFANCGAYASVISMIFTGAEVPIHRFWRTSVTIINIITMVLLLKCTFKWKSYHDKSRTGFKTVYYRKSYISSGVLWSMFTSLHSSMRIRASLFLSNNPIFFYLLTAWSVYTSQCQNYRSICQV